MKTVVLSLLAFLSTTTALATPCDDLLNIASQTGGGSVERARKVIDEQGASVDCQDRQGLSALQYATENLYLPLMQFLIDRHADVRHKDIAGQTALHDAAQSRYYGSPKAMRMLLNAGAEKNLQDKWGQTPLMLAVKTAVPGKLELLVEEYKVDVNLREYDDVDRKPFPLYGNTALILAAGMTGFSDQLKFLLAHGADPRPVNSSGRTALHEAIEARDGSAVKMLLAANSPVNTQDREGNSPLMTAVRIGDGYIENTRMLLNAGADRSLRNAEGKTALEIAEFFAAKGWHIHDKSIALLKSR